MKKLDRLFFGIFLAGLLLGGNAHAKPTENSVLSSLENAEEPKMKLEDWMFNKDSWNSSAAGNTFFSREYSEASLEIENWMLNERLWVESPAQPGREDKEPALHVEKWMINDHLWEKNSRQR